jgi:hypothetical protein
VPGDPDLIEGTRKTDRIDCRTSPDGHDIYGFGGDDLIYGSHHGDLIAGGGGNDTIIGGDGNHADMLDGGPDDDHIDGGWHTDECDDDDNDTYDTIDCETVP